MKIGHFVYHSGSVVPGGNENERKKVLSNSGKYFSGETLLLAC